MTGIRIVLSAYRNERSIKIQSRSLQNNVLFLSQLVTGKAGTVEQHRDGRMVFCSIGSESIEFLIDTGSTVNTITVEVWEAIKRNCRSVIHEVVMKPEEVLNSYANLKPLQLECSFMAMITVQARQKPVLAKFFVVDGTQLSLLSYQTSKQLHLVKIGMAADAAGQINYATLGDSTDTHAIRGEESEFPKIPIEGVRFRIDESVNQRQIIRYNIPKAFEDSVNERLLAMERKGIIERADKEDDVITSVSPLVLVPKGTEDFRIVVDYREVNKLIIREPYPMPTLERIWTDIPTGEGDLFMTKLDLKDAYFHVELHEDVRHLTTFMTANGLMRFRRLPFGLSCAPELFQKVMERLLISCKNIIIYLDDILCYARALPELHGMVEIVKKKLKDNNLTVNEEKSEYDRTTLDFLGFTIDGSGIMPKMSKISEISMFKRPKDVSELRSFLGMMTFISPFIKNFSHKTKVLRDLLQAKTKFEWREEQQEAFEALKQEAEKDLVKRGYFNKNDKTILYTDASPWGLGATLVQEDAETGANRIIACASKSLTKTEGNYPQLHREALAIVWAMTRFAYYLLGHHFILRSDSKALMFMIKNRNNKDVGKRIMSRAEGWFLKIEHYLYTFEHVPGKLNIADAPSRLARNKVDPDFAAEKEPQELCAVTADTGKISEDLLALTTSEVRAVTSGDVEIQLVKSHLKNNTKWPEEIRAFQPFQKELYTVGEALMKQEKMIVPKSLRDRALRAAHRSHPGMSTMKNILRQGLWWPAMDKEIENFVKSCPECQLVTKTCKPLPITLTEMPTNPWDYVAMDFSTASDVNKYKALVLTDYYSRFLVAAPMDKTDTEAVKRVLRRIFNTYSIPKTLKADNGPPFNSIDLQRWLKETWGVKLIHSTPLNPTENGLVERAMQGINKITTIAKLGKKNWAQALEDYVAAYNSWPHHVTKIPPAELMFGRVVRSVVPNSKTDENQYNDDELRDRDRVAKFMRDCHQDKLRRVQATEIAVGDKVLVRQAKKDKADAPFKNAFQEVVEMKGAGRATIKDMSTGKVCDRNVKVLKKFVEREKKQDGMTGEANAKKFEEKDDADGKG